MSLVCRLVGIWETLTFPLFWQSLVQPPLVTVSGHIWPDEASWSGPKWRDDEGWVEYLEDRCVRCGEPIGDGAWRRFWGTPR